MFGIYYSNKIPTSVGQLDPNVSCAEFSYVDSCRTVCAERNVFSAYCISAHLPNEVMSTTEPANGVYFACAKNTEQRILKIQDFINSKSYIEYFCKSFKSSSAFAVIANVMLRIFNILFVYKS